MSLESRLVEVLGPPVEGRVTPDIVEEGATFPCISYQQIGGQAQWFMERAVPDHLHSRIQVNVWAKSRIEANQIARQVEVAICEGFEKSRPEGAFTTTYEEIPGLYGTRQDFGIWYPRD